MDLVVHTYEYDERTVSVRNSHGIHSIYSLVYKLVPVVKGESVVELFAQNFVLGELGTKVDLNLFPVLCCN